MVKGFDVSHWQDDDSFFRALNTLRPDFCICKATEGSTYVDRTYWKKINELKQFGTLRGAYHYARPEHNSVADEAKNFLSTIDFDGKPMLLALDWEGTALNHSPEWALEWLEYVFEHTGIRPLFYCQQSAVRNFELIAKKDYGLWVARYNQNLGSVSPWGTYAIWQRSSGPNNGNVFNGTLEQLYKYATPVKDTIEKQPDFKQSLYDWLGQWEEKYGKHS